MKKAASGLGTTHQYARLGPWTGSHVGSNWTGRAPRTLDEAFPGSQTGLTFTRTRKPRLGAILPALGLMLVGGVLALVAVAAYARHFN